MVVEIDRDLVAPLKARFHGIDLRSADILKIDLSEVLDPAGWRVVANSMAPTVCRCPALESLLELEMLVTSPEDLVPSIRKDVAPIDDIRSTARYRETVMARVLYYGLRGTCASFQ